MTLTQTGTDVAGKYEYNSGTIAGTVPGTTLTGGWTENNGDSKGPIEFVISADGKTFSGWWGYKTTTLPQSGKSTCLDRRKSISRVPPLISFFLSCFTNRIPLATRNGTPHSCHRVKKAKEYFLGIRFPRFCPAI